MTQLLLLSMPGWPTKLGMCCGSAQCTMQVVAHRPQLPLKPKSKSVSHLPAIVNCPPRKSFLYTRLSHISATRELIRSRQEAKKVVTVPLITAVTVASCESQLAWQCKCKCIVCPSVICLTIQRDIGELILTISRSRRMFNCERLHTLSNGKLLFFFV